MPVYPGAFHELFFGGPRSSDDLIAALADQAIFVTGDQLDDLVDAGEIPHVVDLVDDDRSLYVALDSLLHERWFTHRVTAAEIAASVLTVEPDLKPLMLLTDAPPFDRLEDGSPIAEVFTGESVDPNGSLLFPSGTLSAFRPGDLVGVGVGAGGLLIKAVNQPATPPAEWAALVLEAMASADGAGNDGPHDAAPVMLDDLIWRLCNDDVTAFVDPLLPLTELLDWWGLARFGDFVAPAGFDFQGWGVGHRLAELAGTYLLTDEQAVAVLAVKGVFLDLMRFVDERFAPGGGPANAEAADDLAADGSGAAGPPRLPAVPLELADPVVAEAVLWETIGEAVEEAVTLGALVESWEAVATRRVRPALAWLRGKSLERRGKILEAEAAFDESLSLEPSFDNALVDMARYAADRGDAQRAIALLERAGFDEQDPIMVQLRAYLPVDRVDLGRNDPCWCGSGRKYKHCHLGRAQLGPAERATWLYEKAVRFAHDAPYGELLLDLAMVRSEYQNADAVDTTSDPTVLDVVLFEGGVLAEFLDARGELLPDAERQLAAAWLGVERSVFEVTAVRPGKDVTLQDVRTGHGDDVQDIQLSRSVKRGELLTTRLLPAGESMAILGGVEHVPPHLLDRTLEVLGAQQNEVDPVELITILSARFSPPLVKTGKGELPAGKQEPVVQAGARRSPGTGRAEVHPGARRPGSGELR